jgi:hypothetical protein
MEENMEEQSRTEQSKLARRAIADLIQNGEWVDAGRGYKEIIPTEKQMQGADTKTLVNTFEALFAGKTATGEDRCKVTMPRVPAHEEGGGGRDYRYRPVLRLQEEVFEMHGVGREAPARAR